MANGGIQSKLVAEHIEHMDELEPDLDDCKPMVLKMTEAIKMALRLGESGCNIAKQNRVLLSILLLLQLKGDVWSIIKWLVTL